MSVDPATPDSDNLRRSKRKKFRLDVVAAAHGNNQRKSKRDPHGEDDDDDYPYEQLSVLTDMTDLAEDKDDPSEDYEEDTLSKRRTRRSTAHWGDYQDPFVDWVDQSGEFACSKCPSRYESRSSLSNHSKMHAGEKRKYACELCDFSASTMKSLVHHNNVHKRFGVISAQTSPVVVTADNFNSNAPELVAASEEPFSVADDETESVHDTTPPPVLEREGSTEPPPPMLEREFSLSVSPLSRQSSVESEKRVKKVAVRKSNRPSKPAQKRTPINTPKPVRNYKRIKLNESLFSASPPQGSLPNSATPSTSSSVTPSQKSTPPDDRVEAKPSEVQLSDTKPTEAKPTETKPTETIDSDVCEAVFNPEKGRKLRQCPHCPFTATSLTRMNRHSGGHKLKEGFVCPVKGCNYMCRTAGFLQRHYTVHKGNLPWPPKYARRGQEVAKRDKSELIVKAQIRSHRVVSTSGSTMRGCNIGGCDFETTSMSQLILHKTKAHAAKSVFPTHPFLCITCGHRSKTYAGLRVHKLKKHISTAFRYHRTYYLKEMIGDKFFIKYYGGRTEEDGDESADDESFDSMSGEVHVPPGAEPGGKRAVFCCNICPYQAPTMNRCQRHHAKHFVPSQFRCRHCSWSSRNKEVLMTHEKLHDPPVKPEENAADSGAKNIEVSGLPPKEVTAIEMFSCPETLDLGNSLRKWCNKEKASRPEINEHFTRKMIDGMKGFQCIDCPYTSKYRGDMRSHKKRHDIEQMYRCVQCTYTTNRPVSLKDHMKQHVPANMTLMTAKASKVVVNQGIHIGMRRGVGKDRVYCCNKCPYVTLTLGCLWRHHRNHRSTAKFYICSNCSYSSIDMRKMEEHTVIHTALGMNEAMPFVKRVDQEGNPVSSLTDLNSERATERKGKRKTMATTEEKDKDLKPKDDKKRRKRSNESTPSSESPMPVLVKQQSERTPKVKVIEAHVEKETIPKAASVPNFTNVSKHKDETLQPMEPVDITHYRIRSFLGTETSTSAAVTCPDCPFESHDEDLMEKHLFFHLPNSISRPYACTDCTFSTFTPTALLQHLKLHASGIPYDPMEGKQQRNRKPDFIPSGVKGFHCRNCSFKTPNERDFIEHAAYHRHQLINRISVTMKRQPPREEYQRPKMKHLFVARNAKYCKMCTFKCVSQSSFIEHVDRHGWNQLYKCHICDYSDNNKSVVDFHSINHHIMRDQTLHSIHVAAKFRLNRGEMQAPEAETEKPAVEEFAKKSRNLMKCANCDYYCHVASELALHMSVNHSEEPGARQVISYLHMGLMPPQSTITKV